ncbi:MAG: hypothetical protein HYZ53_02510 [Planctomycetes bacterium]|nr:hypothetical protein [Planctomycetota bacterium]
MDHIFATYWALRAGLAVLALAFPLILWIGGHLLADLPLAGSMSEYYHARSAHDPATGEPGHGVMRDAFVGISFAVGMILVLYKGFSKPEDWALNFAGLFAFGVALFPMRWPVGGASAEHCISFHGFCAVSFFLSISSVCIFRASDTLHLIQGETTRKCYKLAYRTIGLLMIALPVVVWVLTSQQIVRDYRTFLLELAGIYVFAVYWLLKTYELHKIKSRWGAALVQVRFEELRLRDLFRLSAMSITPPTVDDRKPVQ